MENKDKTSNLRPERIAVLGIVGSGKTCFFAGLEWVASATENSKFMVIGEKESQKYLHDLHEALKRGVLPAPSDIGKSVPININVVYETSSFTIRSYDIAGEDFKNVANNGIVESPIFRSVIESDTILVCLDCEKDISSCASHSDRLEAVLDMLASERVRSANKKLGVLLTKADLFLKSGDKRSQSAEQIMREKQPGFYKKIMTLGFATRFFFLSSLGCADPAMLRDGQAHPFGYDEIFSWICRDRMWKNVRGKVFLGASIAAVCLVALLSVWGWRTYDSKRRNDFNNEVAAFIAENSVKEIVAPESVIAKANEYFEHSWTDGDNRSGLEQLKKMAFTELEKRAVESMESLRAGGQYERALGIGGEFIAKWNAVWQCSEVLKENKDITAERDQRNEREARKYVAAISAASRPMLRQKLAAVRAFKFFKDENERQEARAAADEMEKLLNNKTYEVTVVEAGTLQNNYRTYVKVYVRECGKGNEVEMCNTDYFDSRKPKWDYKVNSFEWKIRFFNGGINGDEIRVEWLWNAHAGLYSTKIATRTYKGPFAFLDMLSEMEMDVVTGPTHANVVGSAKVKISCDLFPDPIGAKARIEKYILPGTYWH